MLTHWASYRSLKIHQEGIYVRVILGHTVYKHKHKDGVLKLNSFELYILNLKSVFFSETKLSIQNLLVKISISNSSQQLSTFI